MECICRTGCTTRSWIVNQCRALTGMHYHDLTGTLAQQDVELDKLSAVPDDSPYTGGIGLLC